ncbi:unnamed protein product, partial [Mesorhabditis belari]|uniref:Uncharacterized protein n=1 Tax=Mesorhabditis belari TaxID=2138241 RepID=A0AAF3JBD0_9BILA
MVVSIWKILGIAHDLWTYCRSKHNHRSLINWMSKELGLSIKLRSDALLTAKIFFKIKQQFFDEQKLHYKYVGTWRVLENHEQLVSPLAVRNDPTIPRKGGRRQGAILVRCLPKYTQSRKGRKRKEKDIDEIHDDLKPKKATKLLNQEVDLDLPGRRTILLHRMRATFC